MNVFNFNDISTILLFGAHADDEIIGAGGIIHRAKREGKKVYVVTFTTGATAARTVEQKAEMAQARTHEMCAADEILGVERIPLKYSTQNLYANWTQNNKLHKRLIEIVRDKQPDLLLTHYKDDHRDHDAIYKMTGQVVGHAAEKIMTDLGGPWKMPSVLYYCIEGELPETDVIIEISKEDLDAQLRAMATQVSQQRGGYLDHFNHLILGRALSSGAKLYDARKDISSPEILIGLDATLEGIKDKRAQIGQAFYIQPNNPITSLL